MLAYGLVAYLVFLGTCCVFVAFVTGLLPGRSVDAGPLVPALRALAVDLCLLFGFALLHLLIARSPIRLRSRLGTLPIRRSTLLLLWAAWLWFLMAGWLPLPDEVWKAESPWLVAALAGLCAFGWLLALWATFWIDHLDLLGIRQAVLFWSHRAYRPVPFQVEGAYRFVRHPMMLGAVLGLWSTPTMSLGHLLIASVATGYIAAVAAIEERTLANELGEPYRRYLVRVPAFLPRLRPRRRGGLRRR